MAKRDPVRFIGAIALVIMICVLALAGYPLSSQWTAQGSSGGVGYVTMTGTYTSYMTSVNEQGQTVIYGVTTTGTYQVVTTTTAATTSQATTSQATTQATTAYATTTQATTSQTTTSQTTTSTTAPSSWLTITIQGLFKLLDPNGDLISTQTYELVTETSGAAADSLALDLTYDVQGVGIDWSTLNVDCGTSAAAGQPSAANPNALEMVNEVPSLKAWSGMNARTGQVTLTSKIDTVLGGKTWDHARKLSTAVAVACRVSAKVAQGYSLVGGDTVSAVVGPVVGQAWFKWKAPPVPVVPTAAPEEKHDYYVPTPEPEPAPEPSPTPTPDPTPAPKACGGLGCPTPLKATGQTQPSSSLIAERKLYGWQLVGFPMPLIEVFGANEVSMPIQSLLLPALATILGLAVVFFLFRRKKRKRI